MSSNPIFTPLNLYGCRAWCDATQQATGAVASWVDQSGNGNNATQASGAKQPVCTSASIGSNKALIFNGTSSQLTFPSAVQDAITRTTSHSIFIVLKSADNTSQARIILNSAQGVSDSDMLSISIISSNLCAGYYNGSSYNSVSVPFIDTTLGHILSISHLANSTPVGELDGAVMTGSNVPQGDTAAGIILGGEIQDDLKNFKGSIGEVIIYNRVLSATEITAINQYLSQKWNIGLSANTSLSLWLDATDPAGNGTQPSDGASIASWVDKSGNGYTVTQGTGANQPIYKTNILNGNNIIRFNGTSDYMQKTAVTALGNTLTMFIVGTTNGNASFGRGTFFDYTNGSTTNTGCNIINNGSSDGGPKFGIDYNDGTNHQIFSPIITLPNTSILSTYNNGFNAYLYSNNVQIATELVGNLNLSGSGNAFTIGALLNGLSGWWLNGDIGEILVYKGTLSATNMLSILNYLSVKWGIAI